MTTKRDFFQLPDGGSATLYTLSGKDGFEVDVTDFGGALVAVRTPDRNGKCVDVLLGFGNPADYRENDPYFGALVGRYANRIGNARFTLDGKEYQLILNDEPHNACLHGGDCYGRRPWQVKEAGRDFLTLTLESPDGDSGFPGKVCVEVTYRIVGGDALEIDYRGVSDAVTVLSMTNHAYFNLNGEGALEYGDHFIRIAADRHTEVSESLIPTGANPAVEGTDFDLRREKSFAEILQSKPNGFDDNFVLADRDGEMKPNVARARSARTGITLEVSTTAPGVQFYMGYFLSGSAKGKCGSGYPQFSGFCLETQLWPDAVNHPEFPSARLEPGKVYSQRTIYRFGRE